MSRLIKAAFALTSTLATLFVPTISSARPISFQARDGIRVFGDLNPATGESRGTIVLFHMAGSNRAEYRTIAPILNADGFATLAIDQRSGAALWGSANETADKAKRSYKFVDAIPDLEAAVRYASQQHSGPVVIWGSSYSAALVYVIAARHPEVRALLAFSPGEYIEGYSIKSEAQKLSIPAFVTSASDSSEIAEAKALADAVPDHRATQYIPEHGLHGSSTLRQDENPSGSAQNWVPVKAFLEKVLPRK